MTKRLRHLIVCFFFLAAGVQPSFGTTAPVDRIAAIVNGEIITASDLQSAAARARLGLLALTPDGTPSRTPPSEQQLLGQLIEQKLQLQLAQKRGITVEPEEIQKAVDDVKQKNGMPNDAALQKALEEEHSSLEQYKKGLQDQIMILKLVNREVKSGVLLSDQDIRAYYEEHPGLFRTPMEYHLHQIFIPVSKFDTSSTFDQTVRNVADQLKSGADFQALVQQYSEGPDRNANGDLGNLKAEQMLPEMRQAIEHLKPGEVSEPVKTATGAHIFRLDEIIPPQTRPIAEVKPEIQERLYQERSAELYEKWLNDLRASAQVEIKY
ncbi:MAG TPA: peptidyl-prolyl cis-trans isomerase [Nitrospiria bacterium]|jgi:peptidyl-prolyl cis-trans isomerase SurA|nr:peptidyl-prolyl cis-trans isomerase [Nitrospiria bacterium]